MSNTTQFPEFMARLDSILDALGVAPKQTCYIQSSIDWLARAGISPGDALAGLQQRTGIQGTLVVPAYPFSGLHEDYLRRSPAFDLRIGAARTGLLPEMLRRLPAARRSLDPDLPLVAVGPMAAKIAGNQPTGKDPTGADSPFARVLAAGGYLLGLGVSYNYMTLVHVIDSRYQKRYGLPLLTEECFKAAVRDADGQTREVCKRAVLASVQRHIRPARMIDELPTGQDFFRSLAIGDVIFFAWKLRPWEEWACRHVEERLAQGRPPCWLEDYAAYIGNRSNKTGGES